MVQAGDRVTVAGMSGVHKVTRIEEPRGPYHHYACIILGAPFGARKIGEDLLVEAWRCHVIPADVEDWPCGTI